MQVRIFKSNVVSIILLLFYLAAFVIDIIPSGFYNPYNPIVSLFLFMFVPVLNIFSAFALVFGIGIYSFVRLLYFIYLCMAQKN